MISSLTCDVECGFGLGFIVSGSELEFLFGYVRNFFVKGPQGNICRANFVAQSTVYAPTGEMKGAGQVEDGVLSRQAPDTDQILGFQGALVTVAHRTYVPATVALNAFGELA